MGKGKEDLSELIGTKKELVDFIGKGEKSLHDIIKKLGVTDRYVRRMISELNDTGILAHHEVGDMTMHFIRPNSIKIRHETDDFLPLAILLLVSISISVIISIMVLFSLKVLLGTALPLVFLTPYLFYMIFTSKDITHYLYKKPSRLKHDKSKAIERAINIIKNNRRKPRAKTIKKIVENGLCSKQTAYRLYSKHHQT